MNLINLNDIYEMRYNILDLISSLTKLKNRSILEIFVIKIQKFVLDQQIKLSE
jgi:Leucine-rich repeat (LRR) protein